MAILKTVFTKRLLTCLTSINPSLFNILVYSSLVYSSLVYSSLVYSASTYSAPALQVELKQENIILNYNQRPRLSQLLTDAYQHMSHAPYSLGVSLIDTNPVKSTLLSTKKNQLLQTLKKLPEASPQNLYNILSNLKLVNRTPLNLDLEAVQLNSKLNPLLEGRYTLSLPKRPDHIIFIDPISKQDIIKIKLKPGQPLKTYIKEYLAGTNNNDKKYKTFTLIQADKNIIMPTTSYWNNNRYYLSPGAMVFVNLNSNIQEAEQINQKFIELLKYYVAY